MSTGPKVQKSVTKKVTSTTTYTFSHAELCKRLRLPDGTPIKFAVPMNYPQDLTPLGTFMIDCLTAEVTTESSK